MTTTAPDTTPQERIRDLIAAARAERDAGIALAEEADRYGWDKKLIDQAIAAFAGTGQPFSANDLRPLLPDVRASLMGARFLAASNRDEIRRIGVATSTKKNTHSKDVGMWVGVTTEEPA